MPECQNCGAFVTSRYIRVFAPNGESVACCPACPDRTRGGMQDGDRWRETKQPAGDAARQVREDTS